jgi:exopolysaccharide biosynthesis polyprenyl glycosylphosphotransferase
MKRSEIVISGATFLIEILGIIGIFFASYTLRSITDGIPFVQLRIPYIPADAFIPFIITGVVLWWVIFAFARLYSYSADRPVIEVLRETIYRSIIWFFFYIGFVYLTTGYIFDQAIPRLIIVYVWIFSTLYSIFLRLILDIIVRYLHGGNLLSKRKILIINASKQNSYILSEHPSINYIYRESAQDEEEIMHLIREKKVDTVITMDGGKNIGNIQSLIQLCEIYGVSYAYPKILPQVFELPKRDTFIWGIPVVESTSISISIWERIAKRFFDILVSGVGLFLTLPLFLIIALLIKLEDPSWPVLYRNRRVGYGKNEFDLYKFRYMYWKYSVKDAYGIAAHDDQALQYEETLKKSHDTRKGPLYKISDDPRKMRVGKILERLSLDELPQLWNVLKGDMSLIGPRPHQPREVREYSEHHYQVLSIKPGITGMAQVYGREKNSFEEEISLDTYYIEHYSLILDLLILLRTGIVIITRAFRVK